MIEEQKVTCRCLKCLDFNPYFTMSELTKEQDKYVLILIILKYLIQEECPASYVV